MFGRRWRKIGAAAVALLSSVVLLFSGCALSHEETRDEYVTSDPEPGFNENEPGSVGVDQSSADQIDLDRIYEYRTIEAGADWSEIYRIAANGDWLYVYGALCRETDDGSGNVRRDIKIIGMKTDGSEINTVYEYTETEDLQGNISYSTGNAVTVEEMTVTEGGELVIAAREAVSDTERYTVSWFDRSGELRWSSALENAESVGTPLVLGDTLYMPCGNRILCYDGQGALLRQLVEEDFPDEISKDNSGLEIEAVSAIGDNTYVVWTDDLPLRRYVIRTDLQTGQMTDWAEAAGVREARLVPGTKGEYEFLILDSEGIFGWNVQSEERTELVNFINSDVIGANVEQLCSVDKESYLILYRSEEGKKTVGYLCKADPETIQAKQIIRLGLLERRKDYLNAVIRFNQESTQYRIVVVDYTKYSDPIMQLNLDITTKNAPDIFCANARNKVPFDDYARAGALEDIKPWFERDAELSGKDFLTNVFGAMGLNGCWYQMPTAIKIYSYLGDSRIFGKDQSWTLEDYDELTARDPEAIVLYSSREELMRDAMVFCWSRFVDEKGGTCKFDSEEFVQLLEWLNTFPTAENMPEFDINQVRNGKVYSLKTAFRDFYNFNTNLDRLYQHRAEFIGFPSAKGTGGLFVASGVTLAMSSQSVNKEGAWEFIRYFFTDEYQVDKLTTVSDQLPVKLSALEVLADKAMHPMLGILDSYRLNGREVTVEPPSREMIDEWMTFLQSITYADTLDDELYNIITEEAAPFFAGQKSASDVARIIQSRIGVYLAEKQ